MYGPAKLEQDLSALGFTVEFVDGGGQNFALLRNFAVETGRFAGRTVDVGIPVMPDYPNTLASSLHVRSSPHLRDLGSDGTHNVIVSPLGEEWRYWSFNFTDVWQGGRGPHLISIVQGVFDRA